MKKILLLSIISLILLNISCSKNEEISPTDKILQEKEFTNFKDLQTWVGNKMEKIGTKELNGISYTYFVGQKYIWFYNKKQSMKNKKQIVFSLYKLNIKNSPKENFLKTQLANIQLDSYIDLSKCSHTEIENINKNRLLQYFSNTLNIKKDNYATIILSPDRGCPSCINNILLMYTANREFFDSKNILFIIQGSNKIVLKNKLKEYGIEEYNTTFIIDTSSKYDQLLIQSEYNPRLTFVSKQNITFNKIYNPSELEDFFNKILKYSGSNVKIIKNNN